MLPVSVLYGDDQVTVTNIGSTHVDLLTVSDAARRLGAKPRDISDLFYRRELRDDLCPIVGGRRLIPPTYLPVIEMQLRRNGRSLQPPNRGGR